MWLIDFLIRVLSYLLRFVPSLRAPKGQKVRRTFTMHGRGGSGKRSIIRSLNDDFSAFRNVTFRIGGAPRADSDGAIIVVDSSDLGDTEETKGLIRSLAAGGAPLLILANKTDIAGAALRDDIVNALDLAALLASGCARLQMSSVRQQYGYSAGVRWLIAAGKERGAAH